MATLARFDGQLQNAVGQAISGAQVYILTQPANVAALTPLANLFADSAGVTPVTNPLITNGFGEVSAYLAGGIYTVVYVSPFVGTLVYPDQNIAGSGGSVSLTPFSGIPSGTINGSNTVFTLTNSGTPLTVTPTQVTVWRNFPLVQGVGFILGPSAGQITFTVAPQVGDSIFGQGFHA